MPNSRHSAKKDVAEHRYAGHPMPSAALLPRVWHSAKKSFAECIFLPSAIICRVQHSAKKVFAECPIFDTRQRILHSAKSLFPVVQLDDHSLVCDVPPHGLINDNLCPEQDLVEAILHVEQSPVGDFAGEEIYGSRSELTKN